MWKKYVIVFWDVDEDGNEFERVECFDSAEQLVHFISKLDTSVVDDYGVYEYLYQGRVLPR